MGDHFNKLLYIGLSDQKARETLKNDSLTGALVKSSDQVFEIFGGNEVPKGVCSLVYSVCSKIKSQSQCHLPLIIDYVARGRLDSEVKVASALDFLLSKASDEIDIKEFEKASGVGVVVSPEEIEKAVEIVIAKYRDELLERRYQFNIGTLLAETRTTLKFADSKCVKSEVDMQVLHLLGPKTDEDLQQRMVKKVKPVSASNGRGELKAAVVQTKSVEDGDCKTIQDLMRKANFHKPGENHKTDGYIVTKNTMRHLAEHLKRTGGQVRTRFPPEPNGVLHIGHAKAISINFGYAAAHNGVCFLRYDDTNPAKEEERFFKEILDIVQWLGYEPYKVTYSSDYFDELYRLAVRLIENDLAYVCHQSSEQLKGFNPPPSPWRNRPIAESLALFEDMKNGKIYQGQATLRMKITLEEGKQDPVAYRIKMCAHHRTGNKWCIYPTYDFTHCLCDSIEDITHSLCTKEFQSRRSSYYWLCNAVDRYCPVQWEYGRLNVNYTVVSKRKIAKLLSESIVRDWDDPRLFTLAALRRRGFPPEAIHMFCAKLGLTGNNMAVDPMMLESCVREVLNASSKRVMAVLKPMKVTIENFPVSANGPNGGPIEITVLDIPAEPAAGSHVIPLENVIYIDRDDFLEKKPTNSSYRRLCPDQPVGLHHTDYVISVKEMIRGGDGEILELRVVCSRLSDVKKPKAFIHWVSDPISAEVRLYEKLFMHSNPEDLNEVPNGFVSDCNPNSLKIYHNALIERTVHNAKIYDRFQFERVGFFSVDPDSSLGESASKLVFNRTVTLKEDSKK